MDMCRCNHGVAGYGNCDLVEVRYDISCSIDAVHCGPLVGIHLQAPDIVHRPQHFPRTTGQARIELREARGSGIDDVEGKRLTALQE